MNNQLLVFGDGGHFKVVSDILNEKNCKDLIQVLKPGIAKNHFQNKNDWIYEDQLIDFPNINLCESLIAIGDNSIRKKLFVMAKKLGIQASKPIISTHAIVSESAAIGLGSVVMPGAIINAHAIVGQNCIINTGAIIEHDCKVGSHSHIAPSSTLAGGIQVGEETLIGAGSTILPNLTIGDQAIVGAGALVTKDVTSKSKVYGVPAARK